MSLFFFGVGAGCSAEYSQLWELATSLEEHKAEIADWDLGAGIYIDFYLLSGSLKGEHTMPELVR